MLITSLLRSGAIVAIALLSIASPLRSAEPRLPESQPPEPQREFRAAWIATVANIDWPTRKGLSVEEQKAELCALMDTAVELNLNAIILQARPACDALYPSDLEPWSPFLTGSYGRAPQPFYDPLAYAVEQAHSRGLQLHAWLNPYRAHHATSTKGLADGQLPDGHVGKRWPSMVRRYGSQWWLDPGDPQAVAHSLAVVKDIVGRYDVDGLHFDDYFYPYPVTEENDQGKKVEVEFPDEATYATYREGEEAAGRTPLSRDDWRRQNVNEFIRAVSLEVKAAKPQVLFGVSPFGIWRPGHPPTIQGFDPYEKLYADAKLWLEEGWVDYCAPQLYWPIEQKPQSYPVLLQWWADHNPKDRHLWPGLYTSRVGAGEGRGWEADQIARQIEITRQTPGAGGNIHFSMKALVRDDGGLRETLRKGPYARPAVVPESPWLQKSRPNRLTAPAVEVTPTANAFKLDLSDNTQPPFIWLIQTRNDDGWTTRVFPGTQQRLSISLASCDQLAVAGISRSGTKTPSTIVSIGQEDR